MEKKHTGIAFEGATLEEAYAKAASAYNCSITDLESEVIQAPSAGVFGLFKKNAVIKVYKCNKKNQEDKKRKSDVNIKDVSDELENLHKEVETKKDEKLDIASKKSSEIFDDFYDKTSTESIDDNALFEIETQINILFKELPYNLEAVKVSQYDDDTIYIEFQGEDSALLIGKEGYRYKALSYILFNWIHEKYGKMIRLEIAEFLSSQEENMKRYLEPIIEEIKEQGYYKTKTFDGILVHIALSQLREAFPDKYIAVKNNTRGEKYILVNEYKR